MNYIVNSLAQCEVHVARYYYTRGAYLAAINRAQARAGRLPRGAGARRSALHHGASRTTSLGMNGPARRRPARADHELPARAQYLAQRLPGKDDPWWKLW